MQTLAPTLNAANATAAKWCIKLLPSLNDLAFLLPIIVLFAKFNGTQLLFSDGDTGWHIRTGDWILSHHSVPTTDFFSFSHSGATWFAWEWLWDVLAAFVHRSAGLAGLGFLTTLLLGVFSLLVYRLALRNSGNDMVSMLVTTLVVAVSSIHWLARPHLATWLFTLAFVSALESARAKKADRVLLLRIVLPVLMTLWTNLHGGFVAGLVTIFAYAIGEALTAAFQMPNVQANDRCGDSRIESTGFKSAWQSSSLYWQCLLLCSAATMVNPYGWGLHQHIFNYLSNKELLDQIQEFQSISFHAGPAFFFEVLLFLGVASVMINLAAGQYTPVLLICVWAHFALQSARHIPLFAMISAPFAAATISAALVGCRRIPALYSSTETVAGILEDFRRMELTPRLHVASAATLIVIAGLFASGQGPFAPLFNPEGFPAQAMPVLMSQPTGRRIFTTDQWGDYLLYHLYPAQRVFFDGRSDFYGNDFVKVNQRIAAAEHDWKSLLQTFGINLVVLKPETPLSAVLKLTPGSRVLFDNGKVIVFETSRIYQKTSTQVLRMGNSTDRVFSPSHILQSDPRSIATANRQLTS